MPRLIPEDLKEQMIKNHYDVTERNIEDHPPVVKLCAGNATWLLSELDPFYDDIAFGLCDVGFGYPELGSVSITELEEARYQTKNTPLVERDEDFTPSYPMSVYAEAARMCQGITENPEQLAMVDRVRKYAPE